MHARFPKYVLMLAIVVFLPSIGCSDDDSPSAPTALSLSSSALVTAEPETVVPEVLEHRPSCPDLSPFGLRLSFVVGGREDLLVQQLRFAFIDAFGTRITPTGVIPFTPVTIQPGRSTLPVPTPIPSAMPIPLPGASATPGTFVASGTRQAFPFFLEFACGVPRVGTLVTIVETKDRNGRGGTSEVRVRVGA